MRPPATEQTRERGRLAWRTTCIEAGDTHELTSWLFDPRSLTARLQSLGSFAVRPLRQTIARPTRDEAAVLGLRHHELLRTREVALYLNGIPVVFAHTVLPLSPRGPLTPWLKRLGRCSLGALLFSVPRIVRGPLHCRRLDGRHPLYGRALAALGVEQTAAPELWARRSRFTFGRQSLLVTEVFSPAIFREQCAMHRGGYAGKTLRMK